MCGQEFPGLENDIYQAYKGKGLTVVGINPGWSPTSPKGYDLMAIQRFADQGHVTFPVGLDNGNSYQSFSGGFGSSISPFPVDVIVGKDKKIAYVALEYNATAMIAVIEQLLK